MKKSVTEQEDQKKLTPETIKKIGRRFSFVPLLLGIFVAQWKGTKALIPILVVGVLFIPIALWVKSQNK